MNRVISLLRSIRLRQTVTVFLVVLSLLVGTVDIHGHQLQAQAEPVTPEATSYKVEDAKTEAQVKGERIKENAEKSAKLLAEEGKQVKDRAAESAQESGKNLFDNIREKLNLDEPVDPGTKQAVEQVEETASKAIQAPGRALKDATD